MKSRAKRILGTLVVLCVLLLTVGMALIYVQNRADHFARQCAAAAKGRNWQYMERTAREWLALSRSPVAWYWLGSSLKEQARYPEAESAFARVPLDGIRGIDAAVELMELKFHIEQRPLVAIEIAQQLLQRDARLPSPRRHLIYFYAMTLQRSKLNREIRAAIEHHIDLPEHYVYLLTLEDLSFRDAEEVTARWVSADPDSEFIQTIGEVQRLRVARNQARQTPSPELTQRYDDIRRAFISSFDTKDTQPIVLETLLLLAMDRGDVDAASRLLSRVPDEATDDPAFWRYRGWYAMRIGDLRQAEESYRRALELHPLGWQTRHEYANLLRARGEARVAARFQATAGLGTKLIGESRRLSHAQKVTSAWLTELADYAGQCNDFAVANAILRRQRMDRPNSSR